MHTNTLKAGPLAAGESQEVEFMLDLSELSVWDNNLWKFSEVSGTFTAMLGSSSRDIRLESTFSI